MVDTTLRSSAAAVLVPQPSSSAAAGTAAIDGTTIRGARSASSSGARTPASAMKKRSPPTSPRTAARVCAINRCARRQLLLVYLGIGAYCAALGLWWCCMRSDALPLASTNWLALHGQRLIRTHDVQGAALNDTASAPPLKRKLTCIGWRQTGGCDPNGERESANDLACNESVVGGSSGYCAMRDERTGEEVRVMPLTCNSVRRDQTFHCDSAVAFADFQAHVQQLVLSAPSQPQVQNPSSSASVRNGILMVMYPKLLPSVYASIRMLRSLNCSLPVELWYLESEMSAEVIAKQPILQTLVRDFGPVSLHAIAAAEITGFNSKVYAIARTTLDNVLFLDADNIAARDPTFLFTSPEFRATGAVFWPDFWHPSNTIFNVQHESLVWDLVGTPPVDMFEQESGQILINKRTSAAALQLLQYFAFHTPSLFDSLRLVHGDKDLFRLAWLRTNTTFHMVARPPASAGRVNAAGVFCGMTMAQYDPQSQDILFLHRNAKKLTGGTAADKEDPQVLVWTHLQTFDWPANATPAQRYAAAKQHFVIAIYGGGDEFPETGMCYGERRESAGVSGLFHTAAWETLPAALRDLEPKLLTFARDAVSLKLSSHKERPSE